MHQGASFELSRTNIGGFFKFFTIRGDPFDLGGGKKLNTVVKKEIRGQKGTRKWVVEVLSFSCGAFGDILMNGNPSAQPQ